MNVSFFNSAPTGEKGMESVTVRGLSSHTTVATVRAAFESCGEIVSISIAPSSQDDSSDDNAQATVTFGNQDAAMDAVNTMNGRQIDGLQVVVNKLMPQVQSLLSAFAP
ncbi:hypothetical protein EMPS_03844 [Entomortierella parvispora]|uniref:RRM domain-containing protein n=1 Tax=Entomortierella parvispora TaxID=205924 RepID=A0A9P3H7I0_9FUNG|nr:hypothetical protein EMPS_03844 [Entomortierella parvispora]